MERDESDEQIGDTGHGGDTPDAESLIESWGTEVEAKGLTGEQWEQRVIEYRTRDTGARDNQRIVPRRDEPEE